MWKILLLCYRLFDHHDLAVGSQLSIQDKMGIIDIPGTVLSDFKDCPLEEQNEEKAQVLFLPQQCMSDPWVCSWTKESNEQRSSLQLTEPFDCGELGKVPWIDLPQQVELSFISTSTCSIVWRTEDAICHVSFPEGETMYSFVGGDTHFLGVLDIEPAGCRWETTFLHCHRAVNMKDGQVLTNMKGSRVRRDPGRKSQTIRAKIEDLPKELECTWNKVVMKPELLSKVVRLNYFCADPEDLDQPIHVKLSYDGSCTMFLEYQTTSCSLEVPKEMYWQAFLYGDSLTYPFLINVPRNDKDECFWEQNIMQC